MGNGVVWFGVYLVFVAPVVVVVTYGLSPNSNVDVEGCSE